MESLQGVLESWAVVLVQDIGADLDAIVGAHRQDVGVERAVVDGAHGQPVRNGRFAPRRVFFDVGGVQQRPVSEPAQRALGLVGEEHPVPEHR